MTNQFCIGFIKAAQEAGLSPGQAIDLLQGAGGIEANTAIGRQLPEPKTVPTAEEISKGVTTTQAKDNVTKTKNPEIAKLMEEPGIMDWVMKHKLETAGLGAGAAGLAYYLSQRNKEKDKE